METINYIEKRRSPRVLCGKKVKAVDKRLKKSIAIRDISYHGALLKTRTLIDPGEVLDLSMDLPMMANPIDLNAKVVRTVTVCTAWGFRNFDIGVEFIGLNDSHKEELKSTVNYLLGLSNKNNSIDLETAPLKA